MRITVVFQFFSLDRVTVKRDTFIKKDKGKAFKKCVTLAALTGARIEEAYGKETDWTFEVDIKRFSTLFFYLC